MLLSTTERPLVQNCEIASILEALAILAWTDCVRSSAGKILYIDIFSSSNLQKY